MSGEVADLQDRIGRLEHTLGIAEPVQMPSKEEIRRAVSGRLRAWREAAGLTQKQLADSMSVHQSTVMYWESGRNTIYSNKVAAIYQMARDLNVPIDLFAPIDGTEGGALIWWASKVLITDLERRTDPAIKLHLGEALRRMGDDVAGRAVPGGSAKKGVWWTMTRRGRAVRVKCITVPLGPALEVTAFEHAAECPEDNAEDGLVPSLGMSTTASVASWDEGQFVKVKRVPEMLKTCAPLAAKKRKTRSKSWDGWKLKV